MSNRKILFCLPYAGGTAAFFDNISGCVDAEVIAFDYPGHWTRRKEAFAKSIEELTYDILNQILKKKRTKTTNKFEYALFGYSMGSIIAAKLTELILEKNILEKPCHIFLAAHQPYNVIQFPSDNSLEIDEFVKKRTLEFGGIQEKLTDNRVFWRLFLPLYREDYQLISRFDFNKMVFETDIPATVFYSNEDTPLNEMELWKNYYIGDCEFFKYSGNHFFIQNYYKEMAQIINERLK